jgi:hypothetical protein
LLTSSSLTGAAVELEPASGLETLTCPVFKGFTFVLFCAFTSKADDMQTMDNDFIIFILLQFYTKVIFLKCQISFDLKAVFNADKGLLNC